ncbi:MAG: glycosyltransferase [Rickettsiaceae bacterium H1]|nr:glycosyltransferase [Rickettsiaceae bacterium H1]
MPYSFPQTKAKACNYALNFAKGKYITIYDADDKPHSLQLKQF